MDAGYGVGASQANYHYVIRSLHRLDNPDPATHWMPHEGQKVIGQALFVHDCKNVFIQCGRKFGKDLPLSTPIPTPDRGFVELRKLKEGDLIFGDDGLPTKIIGLSPIRIPKTYKITFSDGSTIKASDTHRWQTLTKQARKSSKRNNGGNSGYPPVGPQIFTTEQIKNSLKTGTEWNHAIPNCKPIQLEEKKLPIPPYVLGAWLGDGSSHGATITGIDIEIFENIRKQGFEVRGHKHSNQSWGVLGLSKLLKSENLLQNKHIPNSYLWASSEQRIELVRGLMDTDGYITKKGDCFFYNTNKQITLGLKQILESLGEKVALRVKKTHKKPCFVLQFKPAFNCFGIQRKRERFSSKKKPNHRFIVSVEETISEPSRCIAVDNESHLYLAGENFIPTHNTEIANYCLWRWALLNPNSACYYICPELKQAREINWESKDRRGKDRLPEFGAREFIESVDNTEMRITFKNGSFIKVDGSDNYDAWAGISPNFIVLDEFRSFKPEFYSVMNPNRAVYDAPMVIMGTPPKQIYIDKDTEHQYVELAKEFRTDMLEGGPSLWIKRPSWSNPDPVIQRFLAAEKRKLFRAKKEYEWYREYGAELVPGDSSKIFPQFLSDPTQDLSHVVTHSDMVGFILKEKYAHTRQR